MIRTLPHVRSSGSGPTVILLHSSGSSGKQWEPLTARLAGRFRTHAVDLHGHGRTANWPLDRPMRLDDEVGLIEPLLQSKDGVHLVGHSYGGAVAVKAACRFPEQVLSLSVYEPALFRLLLDDCARDDAATEVMATAASIGAWLEAGYPDRAAALFIDFWSGPGTWRGLPAPHREAIAARMPTIASHFSALFGDGTGRPSLSALRMPMLCLTGEATRPCMRRIDGLLRSALPRASHLVVPRAAHMGPMTHAEDVNALVAAFLGERIAGDARSKAA